MFSIIIPVYNVAPYLRECLDSVLAQTYTDWDAICVDDGSTDGSDAILDEYAAKDARVKVLHTQNGGVSAARNNGLREPKGDWILFLDGDDLFGKDLLRKVEDALKIYADSDIIGFDLGRLEQDGRVVQGKETKPMNCGFCQFAYRRGFIKGILFPSYGMGEDRVFSFRVLAKKPRISKIDYIGYFYRMREGSATHSVVNRRVSLSTIKYHFDMALLVFRIECSMKERVRWLWYFTKTIAGYVKDSFK